MRVKEPSSGAPKLMILTTASSVGGMERIACGLSREFTQRGWSVRTLFPESNRQAALLEWCKQQGVHAEAHPAVLDAAANHRAKDMVQLARLVSAWKPDVVNVHYGDNFISLKDIAALRASGRHRLVVSVHHPTPWTETSARKRYMTRAGALLAHDVTTFSRATREILLQAGISTNKLHLISCGLRPPANLPERQQARTKLGLPSKSLIIGCLSRHEAHKGIGDLLDAASRLDDRQGNLLVAVAGDGPERNRLEKLAAEKLGSRARFLGRVADIDDFLACCDIFCLPSRLEGFGLVYVEAAFHGVPSVATLVGGIPDAVINDKTGLLVSLDDLPSLTQALQRLYDDESLRKQLGDAARQRANSELTEALMAERFSRVFAGAPA